MIRTFFLLTLSNIFMTYAWYGHLKDLKTKPLYLATAVSWGIAFFEYCLQVPTNRIGSQHMTLSPKLLHHTLPLKTQMPSSISTVEKNFYFN